MVTPVFRRQLVSGSLNRCTCQVHISHKYEGYDIRHDYVFDVSRPKLQIELALIFRADIDNATFGSPAVQCFGIGFHMVMEDISFCLKDRIK